MLPPTQDEGISINDEVLSKADDSIEAESSKDGDDSKEDGASNTIDDISFEEGSGLEPLLPPTQDDVINSIGGDVLSKADDSKDADSSNEASDESTTETGISKDEDVSIEVTSKDVPREDVSLNIEDASEDGNISLEDTSSTIDDTKEEKSKDTEEDLSLNIDDISEDDKSVTAYEDDLPQYNQGNSKEGDAAVSKEIGVNKDVISKDKDSVSKDEEAIPKDNQDVSLDNKEDAVEDDAGVNEQGTVSKDKDDMAIDEMSTDDEDVGREAEAGAVYEEGAVRDPPGGVTSTQQEGKEICNKKII